MSNIVCTSRTVLIITDEARRIQGNFFIQNARIENNVILFYRKASILALACTQLVLTSPLLKYADRPFFRCRILLAIRQIRVIWRIRREHFCYWYGNSESHGPEVLISYRTQVVVFQRLKLLPTPTYLY